MLIDLPVYIAFDATASQAVGFGGCDKRCFTLRYDTQDDAVPATYCREYPATDKSSFYPVDDTVFFELMSGDGFRKISAKAARYPTDYASDREAGEILQEEVDSRTQDNSQFGVGA